MTPIFLEERTMKKRIMSALLASAVILSVAGCGNNSTASTTTAAETTTTAAPAETTTTTAVTTTSATSTTKPEEESEPETSDEKYEIDAYTGEILESGFEEQTKKSDPASTAEESETSGTEPSKQESQESQQISVDQAKTIALDHAGVPADQVIFSKAKLEHDDGCLIYDIEFYVDGSADYEYEIDAYSGAILEADSEPWDQTGDIYESDDIDDDDDAEEEDD